MNSDIRTGNLKAMRKTMHQGSLQWEKYDMEADPGEKNNFAGLHPEVLEKAGQVVAAEHTVSENSRWRYRALGED